MQALIDEKHVIMVGDFNFQSVNDGKQIKHAVKNLEKEKWHAITETNILNGMA